MLNPQAPPFHYGSSCLNPCSLLPYPTPYVSGVPYSWQLQHVHHWRTSYFNNCFCLPPYPPSLLSLPPMPSVYPGKLKLEEIDQGDGGKEDELGLLKAGHQTWKIFDSSKGRIGSFTGKRGGRRAASRLLKDHVASRESVLNGQGRGRGKRVWVLKDEPQHPSTTLFTFKESEHENEGRTTVMVKNIPNKISRGKLIQMLDTFCVDENMKGEPNSDADHSAYDFLYLPIDFKNRCNLGYAFINFTTTGAAFRLYKLLHNFKWNTFASQKVCQITYARIQGKSQLLDHFKRSNFCCDSDDFLPVVFSPPRDGCGSCPDPQLVGRRKELYSC